MMLLPSRDEREGRRDRERHHLSFFCESGDFGVEETLKIYLYKYIILLYYTDLSSEQVILRCFQLIHASERERESEEVHL